MYQNRTIYRKFQRKNGLVSFDVTARESNLNIQADTDLSSQALTVLLEARQLIESYIEIYPEFLHSLVPLNPGTLVPPLIKDMLKAGQLAGTGPIASVAGAVAEYTGKHLMNYSREVIVENGGDIFINSLSETIFAVYAGKSPLSMKVGIKVAKRSSPFALCTSSGNVGHSKSFGKADAAVILSSSCILADAVATSICNRVNVPLDIQKAINKGRQIPGVEGMVIIIGKHIGLWGDLKMIAM